MAASDPKLNPHDKQLVKDVLYAELKRVKDQKPFDAHITAVNYYRDHITKLLKKLGERYVY